MDLHRALVDAIKRFEEIGALKQKLKVAAKDSQA
jgi:hypothetical protein